MTIEEAAAAAIAHPWLTERRAGVQHYVTGQHKAWAVTPATDYEYETEADTVLAYVPASGHSVLLLLVRTGDKGGWFIYPGVLRVCSSMNGEEQLPEDFELSDEMRVALRGVR
jgi:hypothetical protein